MSTKTKGATLKRQSSTKVKSRHITRKSKPRTKQSPMTSHPVVAAIAKLVSVEELSQQTGIPTRTLYIMSRKGLIPVYRTGAEQYAIRFNVEEVLQSLRVPPKTEPTTSTGEAAKG